MYPHGSHGTLAAVRRFYPLQYSPSESCRDHMSYSSGRRSSLSLSDRKSIFQGHRTCTRMRLTVQVYLLCIPSLPDNIGSRRENRAFDARTFSPEHHQSSKFRRRPRQYSDWPSISCTLLPYSHQYIFLFRTPYNLNGHLKECRHP